MLQNSKKSYSVDVRIIIISRSFSFARIDVIIMHPQSSSVRIVLPQDFLHTFVMAVDLKKTPLGKLLIT